MHNYLCWCRQKYPKVGNKCWHIELQRCVLENIFTEIRSCNIYKKLTVAEYNDNRPIAESLYWYLTHEFKVTIIVIWINCFKFPQNDFRCKLFHVRGCFFICLYHISTETLHHKDNAPKEEGKYVLDLRLWPMEPNWTRDKNQLKCKCWALISAQDRTRIKKKKWEAGTCATMNNRKTEY